MKSILNSVFVLFGVLLFSMPSLSQIKKNTLLIKANEKIPMENPIQVKEMREYILLVRLPVSYGPEQAKRVREQWNNLLEKWKSNGTFITSFVYPNEGYVVSGSEKLVKNEGIISNNFRLVSNMVLRAENYEAAVNLAKDCPVLEQGGMVEVREIQPRPKTNNDPVEDKIQDRNKATVRKLYEEILNTGNLDMLNQIISDEYAGVRGEKGATGFAETVNSIRMGFPDIKWTVEDLIADGNKVVIRWTWKGTNTGSFRGFPASNKQANDNAIAIYEFSEDKIIGAWIQSDRLGFLQQIGVISVEGIAPPTKK